MVKTVLPVQGAWIQSSVGKNKKHLKGDMSDNYWLTCEHEWIVCFCEVALCEVYLENGNFLSEVLGLLSWGIFWVFQVEKAGKDFCQLEEAVN